MQACKILHLLANHSRLCSEREWCHHKTSWAARCYHGGTKNRHTKIFNFPVKKIFFVCLMIVPDTKTSNAVKKLQRLFDVMIKSNWNVNRFGDWCHIMNSTRKLVCEATHNLLSCRLGQTAWYVEVTKVRSYHIVLWGVKLMWHHTLGRNLIWPFNSMK